MHTIYRASILWTRKSSHKRWEDPLPPRCSIRTEMGVQTLFLPHHSIDTWNKKQKCRDVGVSVRSGFLASGALCRPPSLYPHSVPATAKCLSKCTLKSLHGWKSQDTYQVIQVERRTSRRLPGRKRQWIVIAFKKIFAFKRPQPKHKKNLSSAQDDLEM